MGWSFRVLQFDSWQGLGNFPFTMSRIALETNQPPIQWVLGDLSLMVKWLGFEADCSPPSSSKVKNMWSYTSTTPIHVNGMVPT
jgi:hypothetical protein